MLGRGRCFGRENQGLFRSLIKDQTTWRKLQDKISLFLGVARCVTRDILYP